MPTNADKPRNHVAETFWALRKESLYWRDDEHRPVGRSEDIVSRALRGAGTSILDGVREALAEAERTLGAARARLVPMRLADRCQLLRPRLPVEQQECCDRVLAAIAKEDRTRAYHEVIHWRGYVERHSLAAKIAIKAPTVAKVIELKPVVDDSEWEPVFDEGFIP